MKKLRERIEEFWDNRALLNDLESKEVVRRVIDMLDKGEIRCAQKVNSEHTTQTGDQADARSGWIVNEWVKKAILMYFPIQTNHLIRACDLEFFDKIGTKKDLEKLGVRVVPHGVARYGSYLAPGVIMMPSYVNIGAYVDSGTMVDTWATVGSCAQIGRRVHLSGGVGIGGVLEPVQAAPVIVEDNCFIGSRCIIVEGAFVGEGAVLGANVVVTGSTRIIDVTQSDPIEYRGYIPPRSVVIPGSYPKKFAAGEYNVPCALIIGTRKPSTDLKTSLNDALRDYGVSF